MFKTKQLRNERMEAALMNTIEKLHQFAPTDEGIKARQVIVDREYAKIDKEQASINEGFKYEPAKQDASEIENPDIINYWTIGDGAVFELKDGRFESLDQHGRGNYHETFDEAVAEQLIAQFDYHKEDWDKNNPPLDYSYNIIQSELVNTIKLPPGYEIKDIDHSHISTSLYVTIGKEGEAGDDNSFKYRISDHDDKYGGNDRHIFVAGPTIKDYAKGIDELENKIWEDTGNKLYQGAPVAHHPVH